MARLQDFPSVTPNTANDNLLIVQSAGQGNAKIDTVGQKIATDTTHSGLTTTSKKLVGAINELNTNKVNKSAISSLITLSEKSGSIASFSTDIADKLYSCYVNVTAQQAGSGTPSPSNVRSISGWSACNLTGCGNNVWSETWELGYYNVTNGTFTSRNDGICSKHDKPIIVKPNTTYRIRVPYSTTLANAILFYDGNDDYIDWVRVDTGGSVVSGTFTTPSNACYCRFYLNNAYGTTYNNNISINYPSTDTSYHKYNGTTHNIPFNTTVYGGVLDILSGVLKVTHKYAEVGGSESWNMGTTSNFRYFDSVTTYSDSYAWNINTISNIGSKQGTYPYVQFNGSKAIRYAVSLSDEINTVAKLQTLLNTTHLQVVYELATPTVIQLTPTEVKTILGQNNIFGDCGDIDLKYLETIGNLL